MMYLEEKVLDWAKTGIQDQNENENEAAVVHKDSNGALLSTGDTVTIIKDLNVKGSSITAKRGTAIRNISLVHDNSEQIEGRVNGQQLVILTQFVKRTS
jgi:protein PhnA